MRENNDNILLHWVLFYLFCFKSHNEARFTHGYENDEVDDYDFSAKWNWKFAIHYKMLYVYLKIYVYIYK